ncbi:MAG: hypothetical protein AAB368_14100, partial [bacterium]
MRPAALAIRSWLVWGWALAVLALFATRHPPGFARAVAEFLVPWRADGWSPATWSRLAAHVRPCLALAVFIGAAWPAGFRLIRWLRLRPAPGCWGTLERAALALLSAWVVAGLLVAGLALCGLARAPRLADLAAAGAVAGFRTAAAAARSAGSA